jgi:hypothetical protein
MVYFVLIGLGIAFLVIGIVLVVKNSRFVKMATKTTGQIVDMSTFTGDRGHTMYSAVIEFKTFDNKAIRFPHPSSSTRKPKLGREVKVIYREENPEKAKLDSAFGLYIAPVIVFAFGVVMLAIALTL